MLNVQQGSFEYQLLKSFCLIRPENQTLVYRLRGERSEATRRFYGTWYNTFICTKEPDSLHPKINSITVKKYNIF